MMRGPRVAALAAHNTTVAAFLLPALALWVPSGYSYGAVLLLLGALGFAPLWLRRKPDTATLGLALLLLGMGGLAFLLSLDLGASRWDKALKWWLGVPCLLYLVACPPRPQAFAAGLPWGCTGMGALALWQVVGQGLERATGYTNTIQWGNLALLLAFTPRFKDRVGLAATEISGFVHEGRENTSVGLRLAQYQLVSEMIPQKPWLGWGAHGFVQEMRRRVEAGDYVPEMMSYLEIHNIFLDAWVKVGLGGVLLQAALLAWVLAMFWPSRRRMARHVPDLPDAPETPAWRQVLALRVMGVVVVACYAVFGMSQPFFNHNSGIMVFVFYVAVLWAALKNAEHAG